MGRNSGKRGKEQGTDGRNSLLAGLQTVLLGRTGRQLRAASETPAMSERTQATSNTMQTLIRSLV